MTILYVSSSRSAWFESPDAAEHFRSAPYSIDAIGYNLEKLGWKVCWAGWKTTHNPFTLAKKIDEVKPDIIYTYGSTVALFPVILRKLHICKHRKFNVVHGWDDPYGRVWGEMFGWPGKVFMNWMEKRIVKNSDAVVTLSYALQKKGAGWGVDCKYIPNGADPIPVQSANPTISQSDNAPRLAGRYNLVYTGDKVRWKRTEDICRAMRELPKDVKLYLTGSVPDYLKPYASENCIFLGFVPKATQLAVMAQADAFVSTSNQDCNAKLQEYLRYKKPILGFDGEANYFFKNGHNALLAKDGDYVPLIKRLLEEPELGPTLVANAAAEIPVYSWREIAQQFEAYFKEICE